MERKDIRVAILRIEGTNNEQEMFEAYHELGAKPELVHLNQLIRDDIPEEEKRSLGDYHILMFPGGFSAGDYVRAGALFAARVKSYLGKDLEAFVEAKKPVGGTCNGFQILVELGLLPGDDKGRATAEPTAVLNRNDSALFECRPTLLKHVNKGKCVWTSAIPDGEVRMIPSAHAEGKLMFENLLSEETLARLAANDQVVFQYVDDKGGKAAYPWSPSGSTQGIAGITNATGTVFGMMPHPERVRWRYQHPDWTRSGKDPAGEGDGRAVFESVLQYVETTF